MEAAQGHLFCLLLLGRLWGDPSHQDPGPGRRFSEYKLCADDKCSVLMYQGEALRDFTGPDCRFMNFKKGDPVYVYYKLASPEVWAGSVGHTFGYFPKDLIKVLRVYTKEELQVPTDETNFVCFERRRDDFDTYNVEELLAFWELYDSASEESEKAVGEASPRVEKPPEVSEESEPEPDGVEATSEESESAFSESTKDLKEQILAQKSHPHADSQTEKAQGEQSSFDPFEKMLQDKLRVPESESKTSNSSQVSGEQETIDAYKLLKTKMTLYLKTKFGSTTDALVSDDETTRLVTSLEDDFDDELNADYYAIENDEEENTDKFDELPLLTLIGGDDMKMAVKSGMEHYSTDKEPNSNEKDKVEVALPPGIKNDDKNTLTNRGDTFFSVVTRGEEKTSMMALESCTSEEEKDCDDALVPDSKQRKPQSATDYTDPENAENGLFVDASKINDEKYSEMDTKVYVEGKGRDAQESKRGLVQNESKLEEAKPEGTTVYSSPESGKLSSLPAAGNGKDTLKSAPLITLPPLQKGWAGLTEEMQLPHEDDFSQENPGDLNMQLPKEHSLLDQPMSRDRDGLEVSQKPDMEKDVDPGLLTTEYTPVDAADTKKQGETNAEEPASVTYLENTIPLMYSFMLYLTEMLLVIVPDDVQPGPDFYGRPWKPILLIIFFGIISFAGFFWRTVLVVSGQDGEPALTHQTLMDKTKTLKETNKMLADKAKSLRVMLELEKEQNTKNQHLVMVNKKSIETIKDVISVQTALKEAKLSEEKVKSKWHQVQEENARLKKKKEQLQRKIADSRKLHAELSQQIKSFEKSQKDLEVALTDKDDTINALTNCITQLNQFKSALESEDQNRGGNESDVLANGEVGGDRSEKMKNQIKQMMDVSQTQTAVSIVEEDLKLLQLKLRASVSTKCNLEDQIKKLEDDRNSLQSTKGVLRDECKALRQKVEILNEFYLEKELALRKKLSQEENAQQEREQQLSGADEKVVVAAEEVKIYKQRIAEMEEKLQKTERAFKDQIAAYEKLVHNNWLKARAAERALSGEKKEAANLRCRYLKMTQKMEMHQDEPVKPMPGRPNTQNPPLRDPGSGPAPVMNSSHKSSSQAEQTGPQEPGVSSAPTMTSLAEHPVAVNMATNGPPSFPGVPLVGSSMGGPIPPPIRYGPPPQLCGPFGPRPLPPPFVPGMRPPLGLREYAPGVPPGKRDLPVDPRGFSPGPTPFRPLGPREYCISGTLLPPPTHSPQDYPPPPAVRDLMPSGPRDEPPPASESSGQYCSQSLKQTM